MNKIAWRPLPTKPHAATRIAVTVGLISVAYGIHEFQLEVAGLSVAEVIFSLRDLLNINDAVGAYANGVRVPMDYVLTVGDRVIFVRPWGRKGATGYGRGDGPGAKLEVPAGSPAWITAELVERTIAVCQPHYPQRLTPNDAVEILINMGRYFDLLLDA
jgi:hypothetical protein